jgi:intracellular sulfur oxidation DsrE/DsrF family protein
MQQKVINLKKDGVDFEVCKNTLVGKKINYKSDLFDVSEKDIVPSGVAEVAILQHKGYAYIKP